VPDSVANELVEMRARVVELEKRLSQLADAEEQLSGAKAQAQALLDNIPYMAWMKNTRGAFLAVNEAFVRACGYERRDILGKSDRDVWPIEHAERYMADDLRIMASGEKFFVEEPIHEGGDVKWFETFKTPIHNSTGGIIGTVGLARDITERKRAEEQRRQLERRMQETQKLESLGVLAGGIAHDFNNLLVGVLANADLVLDGLRRSEDRESILERVTDIKNAAMHAAGLTNQMLAYSGRGRFDVRSISINEMIHGMGHLLIASISKKAKVQYELAPSLPAVRADVAQIRQVIMNLITNASDALEGRTGTIRVSTGTQVVSDSVHDLYGPTPLARGTYVYFEVADDGCGMTDEARERLFEPFFTTKFTGRGLGLSTVQGIVRGHGGGITLRSKPGEGTTIKVFLPCAAERVAVLEPDSAQRQPRAEWTGSGLVLLVDDDEQVRVVTDLLLRSMGFDVLAVATGREALIEFDRRASELRLVMLDLTMPDISGDQVLHELRQRRADVPVLLCSGYSEDDASRRVGRQGVVGFLQKPYPLDLLKARLQDLLD
jgi:two-component system cell cycle sensor histidine kinase/response regulator CckA